MLKKKSALPIFLLAAVLIFIAYSSSVPLMSSQGIGWLHTEGTKILNASNQEVVFNSIDTMSFIAYPEYGAVQEIFPSDIQLFRSKGLNTVRISFSLDQALYSHGASQQTPTALSYYANFWTILDSLVDATEQYGMWLIIDHATGQPSWSTYFSAGSGCGMPAWMYDGSWSYQPTRYSTSAYEQATIDFFDLSKTSNDNIRSVFKTMWKDVANRYRDRGHVVFSLMNEPLMDIQISSGQMVTFPSYYRTLMLATVDAIRSVDYNNHIIDINNAYFYDGPAARWDFNKDIVYDRVNIMRDQHLYGNYFASDTIYNVEAKYAGYAWLNNQPQFFGEFGVTDEGMSYSMTLAQDTNFIQSAHTLKKPDGSTQPVGWSYCGYYPFRSEPSSGVWNVLSGNLYSGILYPTSGGQQFALTISSSLGGSTDPAVGLHSYASGSIVAVSATASSGYYFSEWILDSVSHLTTNPVVVTMTQDHSVQAVFIPNAVSFTLTVSSTSGGTTNPIAGSYQFDSNSNVQISATANAGYLFDHWLVNSQLSAENPLSLTMNKDYSVQAYFQLEVPLSITLNVVSSGNGAVSPVGSRVLVVGQSYSFSASPLSGYEFDCWLLESVNIGSSNPLQLEATSDMDGKTLAATFSIIIIPPPSHMTVTSLAGSGGSVVPSGPSTLTVGDTVTFAASAQSGYAFDYWLFGSEILSENPLHLTVTNDMDGKNLTAKFKVVFTFPQTLTVPDAYIIGGVAVAFSGVAVLFVRRRRLR